MTVTLGGNIFHEYFLQYSSQFAQCTSIPYRPTLMLPMWMFSVLCVFVMITLYLFIIIKITFFHCRLSICICIILNICVFMLNYLCSFGTMACDIIKKMTVIAYVLHCWTQMTILIYPFCS